MKWILLLLVFSNSGPAQPVQFEFATKPACEAARDSILAEFRNSFTGTWANGERLMTDIVTGNISIVAARAVKAFCLQQ
jgi:predicted HAD superfamily phosphohydrolase YqeG